MVKTLLKSGVLFDPAEFGVMLPSHQGCFNATRRFDKNPDFEVPMEILEEAQSWLLNTYRPYAETCPLTPEEDMQWNRKSSPGHYFKSLGYKDTGEVLDCSDAMFAMRDFVPNPQFPTLWITAVKEEMLPKQKLDDNMPRTFIIPDKRYHYLCQHLMLSQHKLFKTLGSDFDFQETSGYNFFNGGFTRLMELLDQFKTKFEGDCSKWDCSLLKIMFRTFVLPLRKMLFKPDYPYNGGRREQVAWYNMLLEDVYEDMICAFVKMTNAQVIQILMAMKSGFLNTSDDNTKIHQGIMRCWLIMAMLTYGVEMEVLRFLMADDHIGATDCLDMRVLGFEFRRDCYAKFGITLKPEADLVSDTLEGHTFLGFKAHWSTYYHCWVPVFNTRRLCCMLCNSKPGTDAVVRFARVNACRILAFFTEERDRFAQLARSLWRKEFLTKNPYEPGSVEALEFASLASCWSDSEVEALWFGNEKRVVSSGDGLENKKVLSKDATKEDNHRNHEIDNKQQDAAKRLIQFVFPEEEGEEEEQI